MNRPVMVLQLAVLGLVSVLLAVLELVFQATYAGPVPLPLGTVAIVLSMPWLVRAFTETWPTIAGAAMPLLLWFVVTAVFGALGPGGDALLVPTWQTLLLLASGVLVGVLCFRRAVDRLAASRASDGPPGMRVRDVGSPL